MNKHKVKIYGKNGLVQEVEIESALAKIVYNPDMSEYKKADVSAVFKEAARFPPYRNRIIELLEEKLTCCQCKEETNEI